MSNKSKIIIGVATVAALVYVGLVFDIPYKNRQDNSAAGTILETPDYIKVSMPESGSLIASTAEFKGEARGSWFFEASFPIEVYSVNGDVLGRGSARAQGDWMTENFVPWTAKVAFDPGSTTVGYVRFKKDNPSGLPENDAYLDVPVRFK